MKSVIADGKSYIRNADGREEVYDILNDPADSHDLSGSIDSSSLLDRLRGTLENLLVEEETIPQ